MSLIGRPIAELDSPQLLIDLDVLDTNLRRMQEACRQRGIALRVHFKSLKCGGLAQYLVQRGVTGFLCAKLNEAEVLAAAGIDDIFLANQLVGSQILQRLADLAQRAKVRVCVDDADNVRALGQAARQAGVVLEVLIEVDIGMHRCGVEPGESALALARVIQGESGLRFVGLQGYDGHLQMLVDREEKTTLCLAGLEKLVATRRLLEKAGIQVEVVTGGGTGTWEWVSAFDGVTELQPGSFLLMDAAYHTVRPEFGCSLSILATVVSRRPTWYVLDAGSKAVSKDFGMPAIKGQTQEQVTKLAEEHTLVACDNEVPHIGEQREIIPAHCCATMNLHRTCAAVRRGRIEALWKIEASGRYD